MTCFLFMRIGGRKFILVLIVRCNWALEVALVVKNLLANTGDTGDEGLIPGLGRSPGVGNGNLLQYSCLKIPWTEELGGLQSMGSQRVGYN